MGPPAPPGAPDILRAMHTVEAVLVVEDWFFEKVRKELAKKAPLSDFKALSGANGHDHLLHFTQFLFFLEALECRDADGIVAFITTHNQRIAALLADPAFAKSAREFQRALFGARRQFRGPVS